ncbi:MAG: Rieske (2Fe-2S) protein [Desulfurococcales archaeon]|nr:Rieske (2Fe-2S) protein [Desulfurococcales archaeon]
MVWRTTISFAALKRAGQASVKVRDKVVFIAVVGDELYAMDAVCSHSRCILGIIDREKLTVKCPCHDAVFDLRTGEMLEPPYVAPDVPKERMGLKTYNARVNKGFVEVDVE